MQDEALAAAGERAEAALTSALAAAQSEHEADKQVLIAAAHAAACDAESDYSSKLTLAEQAHAEALLALKQVSVSHMSLQWTSFSIALLASI